MVALPNCVRHLFIVMHRQLRLLIEKPVQLEIGIMFQPFIAVLLCAASSLIAIQQEQQKTSPVRPPEIKGFEVGVLRCFKA